MVLMRRDAGSSEAAGSDEEGDSDGNGDAALGTAAPSASCAEASPGGVARDGAPSSVPAISVAPIFGAAALEGASDDGAPDDGATDDVSKPLMTAVRLVDGPQSALQLAPQLAPQVAEPRFGNPLPAAATAAAAGGLGCAALSAAAPPRGGAPHSILFRRFGEAGGERRSASVTGRPCTRPCAICPSIVSVHPIGGARSPLEARFAALGASRSPSPWPRGVPPAKAPAGLLLS